MQEFDAPFLGNLIVDASSSVLSPSGFTVALDIVGQAGKALTLATTIAMQFLLFVLLWAWGTQYVQARDGWGTRWRFGLIQLGVAVALLVIAAAIFDLAAASSVFSAGDWWTYLWQTVFFTTLFLTVAHALDRFAAPARPAATVAPADAAGGGRPTPVPARAPADRHRCWSAVRRGAASWRWRADWPSSSRRPSSWGGSSPTRPRPGFVACSWAGCRRP